MDFKNIYCSKDKISNNIIAVYQFANDNAAKRNFRVNVMELVRKGNISMLELMKDTDVYKFDGVKFSFVFSIKDLVPVADNGESNEKAKDN